MSTLTVAVVVRAVRAEESFDADYGDLKQAGVHVVSFLAALLPLLGIAKLLPILGAFGMNWLAAAAKLRRTDIRLGLMIHLAFFWIAPFYGFFHAPWFLAQTVALPCDGLPIVQAIVVVLSLAIAASAGRRTAVWMIR
jgi:hypothetical protein